jgi:integrase/recombinase XerD
MIMVRRVSGPFTGPLLPYLVGFRVHLVEQGYSADSIDRQFLLMAHVSRWLAGRNLNGVDLTVARGREFLQARRAEGYAHPVSMRGMSPLLEYLRGISVAPMPETDTAGRPMDVLLGRYRRYLVEERGLSASSTVPHYLDVAAVFFGHLLIREPADLGGLAGSQVTDFVLAESRRRSAGYTKSIATRLRCLLRYLHVEGLIPNALVTVVPSVASWQLTVLPQAISAADVARLLKSCDRRRAIGRRDFAILSVLVRLGLRAGEVAALRLDDIDWRLGEVTVHGKGNREDRLPLPHDVGDAIVGWLQRGRPPGASQAVFTVSWRRTARCPPGVSRESCVRPVGGQVFSRWVPTGFDTRSRPRPYGPGEAWPRSGSSCVKTTQPRRPFTPRSTGLRCPRWFSPGPVVRHERPSSVLG